MRKTKQIMRIIALAIFTIMFGVMSIGSTSRTEYSDSEAYAPEQVSMAEAGTVTRYIPSAQQIPEPFTKPTDMPVPQKAEVELAPEITWEVEKQQETAAASSNYVYYDVPLGDDEQEYAQDLCVFYEFPYYDVIVSMIENESSFTEKAVSRTNDYGYMQINAINHQTLKEEIGVYDMLDGKQNIHAGIYLMQKLYHKYGDIWLALMAYNCGENGAARLWAKGVYSTDYCWEIMQDAAELPMRTN